jgi:hypothetical protein
MLPPTTDRLLTTSAAFISAKFEFERAISDARRDGLPDEEIARLVGFPEGDQHRPGHSRPVRRLHPGEALVPDLAGFSRHGLDSETRDFRTSAELTPKWRGESRSVMARAGR